MSSQSGADISDCGRYRYALWRVWDPSQKLLNFVLLNPSTADAEQSDATLTKCVTRAQMLGFGGIHVTNLYALRSRDPSVLRRDPNPIGPDNDIHITVAARRCALVVCGWGIHAEDGCVGRAAQVQKLLYSAGRQPYVLGLTKGGHPRHPLYVAYSCAPQRWTGSDTR